MKKILTILFVLLISQIVCAQTEAYKVAEYDFNGIGCDNFFRYVVFTDEIAKNDGNKGLVVIYTGDTKERFGNILGYAKSSIFGVENWINFEKGRVSVMILEGGEFFAQEFWIIPKDAKPPYSDSYHFDWSKVESKYYFSRACLKCEGDYPFWDSVRADFEDFANILKQFPNYKGQIIVNDFDELAIVRKNLTFTQKLPRNRYSIQFRKKKKGQEDTMSVDLYLIPSNQNLSAKY